ncbi:MAG: thioredoxin [Steroidobacteraceae bacterium]
MSVRDIDTAQFDSEVLAAKGPVLVEYWAEWCGPCKMMGPLLEETAHAYGEQMPIVKVNVDHEPAIASRYHVRSIPTMMIFRDGAPVATQVGATNRSKLEGFIEAQLAAAA